MPRAIPPRPELLFGVFDRYGNPVNEFSREPFQVGYLICPRYYSGRHVRENKSTLEEIMPMEIEAWEARLRVAYIANTDMFTVLNGQQVNHVTCGSNGWDYDALNFHMTRGGIVKLHRTREAWNSIHIPERAESPFTVRKFLKTGKTIRCDDGTSIEFNFYGKLVLTEAPDWRLEEIYGEP